MAEEQVEPGECATFKFNIGPATSGSREFFQLVFEGICWIPDTEFDLPIPIPIPTPTIRFDPPQPTWTPNDLERRWDGIKRRLAFVRDRVIPSRSKDVTTDS